jgi:Zn-dependent protease with chaperone function
MEICSAPSRVLLGFAGYVGPRLRRCVSSVFNYFTGISVLVVIVAILCIPPAFVIGWISRLSVLGMSRAREFSADAAAATLTGRPSALASALVKLERQREWVPRADLREVEAYAVLCIVGTYRAGLRRLLSTHPATVARVKRLEEMEGRMQAGPYAARP